jgi:hypothetical protein
MIYVQELLKFIDDMYCSDIPSMNVMFLKGQLYALYETNVISSEIWHEYSKKCTKIEQHRKLREQSELG